MPTKYADLFQALAEPFSPQEVKHRPGGNGRQLSYVTARSVANRLDSVLGPEAWSDRYYEVCDVLFCEITVTLPDGTKISKADAGGFKRMTERDRSGQEVTDEENTDKTGASDAFKRAAAKLLVARYLYQDGVPDFGGEPRATNGHAPPDVPRVTSPPTRREPAPEAPRRESSYQANGNGNGSPPRTGKALFAWAKDQGKRLQLGEWELINRLQRWSKPNGWTERIGDWDDQMTAAGYAFLAPEVAKLAGGGPEHESQEPPAEVADDPNAGPCTIRQSDPLSHTKRAIVQAVRECVERTNGKKPTEAQVQHEIDKLSEGVNAGLVIGSIRDFGDFGPLSKVQADARKWLEELKTVPEGL